MNYTKMYEELISTAVNRDGVDGYSERHHIVPKSLGGSNDRSNLVDLTAREHFIAHWYLANIHNNKEMWCAMNVMINSSAVSDNTLNDLAGVYSKSREMYAKSISGEGNPFFGKRHSDKVKMRLSEIALLRTGDMSPAWRGGAKKTCPDCGEQRKSRGNDIRLCSECLTKRKVANAKRVNYSCSCGAKLSNGNMKQCRKCHEKEMLDKPWINGRANLDVWRNAKYIMNIWLSEGKCGSKSLADKLNLPRSAVTKIHSKLKAGWNPTNDKAWLEFASNG